MRHKNGAVVVDGRSAGAAEDASVAPEPAARRKPPGVGWVSEHQIVAGAIFGFGWGVIMRAWMRFIALNPEFSWEGTFFIVGASTIVGALLGLARRRRAAGGVGWWRTTVLSLGLLGAGGAVMWPSVMLGALGLGIRRWFPLRVALILAAVGAQVPVLQAVIEENWRMSGIEAVIAVAWYAPLLAVDAWAFSVVFAPAAEHAPPAGWLRRGAFAVPILLMLAGSVLVMGVSG